MKITTALFHPLATSALLAAVLALFTASASGEQASILLLDCNADVCQAHITAWAITNTPVTSGLVLISCGHEE